MPKTLKRPTPHPDGLRFRQALLARRLTLGQWARLQRVKHPIVSRVLSGSGSSQRVAKAISRFAEQYGPVSQKAG